MLHSGLPRAGREGASAERADSAKPHDQLELDCWRERPSACILGFVETVLSVIQVIIAIIVIFLVLMHSGKDSGLSGAFGVGTGTGPLGGGSMVERNLNRWTVFFAILFVLNTIVLLRKLA